MAHEITEPAQGASTRRNWANDVAIDSILESGCDDSLKTAMLQHVGRAVEADEAEREITAERMLDEVQFGGWESGWSW